MLLIIIVLILLFGLGGGSYYGRQRWGPTGGIGIPGLILLLFLFWLFFCGGMTNFRHF